MYKRIIVLCTLFLLLSTISYAARIQFHEGDVGKEIAEIQVKLKDQGYYSGKVDGNFTSAMTKAVKKFQQGKKLKADGIVDEKTYSSLFAAPVTSSDQNQNSKIAKITDTAMHLVGVPYKWGGVTAKGFDCSGFTWYVFDKNAIELPRTADVQYKVGKMVSRSDLRKGDVVFFTTYEPGASHCGIYLGNGNFIHASSSKGVMVSNLSDSYWKTRYFGARRIV